MQKARTFMTGRSQAIRIPLEYRLPDEEIVINRIGDTITLTPVSKLGSAFCRASTVSQTISWRKDVQNSLLICRGSICDVHAW